MCMQSMWQKIQSEVNSILEEALHVAHLHHHSLQLGVILDGHLAVLSAEALDKHSRDHKHQESP